MSMHHLNPYMPFVMKQMWHHLPQLPEADGVTANMLTLANFPQMDNNGPLVREEDAIATFECFQALTRSIRNARAECEAKEVAAGNLVQLVVQDRVEVYLPLSSLIISRRRGNGWRHN